MKCKQKLCQRSKNILPSGSCTICQDVMDEATTKLEANKKIANFKKVDLDLKLMVETHNKLIQGTQVDPKTVNILVIGGVINILSQSEAIEEIEARVKTLEHEDPTNKAKIEYLENWVLKQNKSIDDLTEKLGRLDKNGVLAKESDDIKALEKKVVGIEIKVTSLKNSPFKKKDKTEPLDTNLQL